MESNISQPSLLSESFPARYDGESLTKTQIIETLQKTEAELARVRALLTPRVQSPPEAVKVLRDNCISWERECFYTICLNARGNVLGVHVTAAGSLACVETHPREVFLPAIRTVAHSIIIAHNHPSGDVEPSRSDLDLTSRMVKAGEIIGIPVLDHFVFSEQKHVSMAALGLLTPK